jgi:hypothetical protein
MPCIVKRMKGPDGQVGDPITAAAPRPADMLLERLVVDELHHEHPHAMALLDFVNGRDVRMVSMSARISHTPRRVPGKSGMVAQV